MITQLKRYKNLNEEEIDSKIYGVVTALVTNNKDKDGLQKLMRSATKKREKIK